MKKDTKNYFTIFYIGFILGGIIAILIYNFL
jgi:glycerol uptake facilitator-like aquaporin